MFLQVDGLRIALYVRGTADQLLNFVKLFVVLQFAFFFIPKEWKCMLILNNSYYVYGHTKLNMQLYGLEINIPIYFQILSCHSFFIALLSFQAFTQRAPDVLSDLLVRNIKSMLLCQTCVCTCELGKKNGVEISRCLCLLHKPTTGTTSICVHSPCRLIANCTYNDNYGTCTLCGSC